MQVLNVVVCSSEILELVSLQPLPAYICNPVSCATSSALIDGNHDYGEDVKIDTPKVV